MAQGFEPTTSLTWVISHNHQTRAPALTKQELAKSNQIPYLIVVVIIDIFIGRQCQSLLLVEAVQVDKHRQANIVAIPVIAVIIITAMVINNMYRVTSANRYTHTLQQIANSFVRSAVLCFFNVNLLLL